MEEKNSEVLQLDSHVTRVSSIAALERKHSSGDLQSRLKTRKMLGVGETDNGDVHRSKISQVLGHNEHLFVRLPRCYWWWHFIVASVFTVHGLYKIFTFITASDDSPMNSLAMKKFYGSTLLGFAFMLWRMLGTTDKTVARDLMSAVFITQIAQLFTFFKTLYLNEWGKLTDLSLPLFLLLGSVYFFFAIGSSRAGLRRSLSNKDLRDRQPTPEDSPSVPDSEMKKLE